MSTQSDGWQKNRRTLLLIESSQNSHSSMEKPNYKTDTRCPLFFPIAWTAFWRNQTWNWVTYFSDFSTVEIHKCSSEVINLNIMISHPCRKQWLKNLWRLGFFSGVRFASCTYVNCSYTKAKRWQCFGVAKVPEKANWCAAGWLPPDSALPKESWWHCRGLWSGQTDGWSRGAVPGQAVTVNCSCCIQRAVP